MAATGDARDPRPRPAGSVAGHDPAVSNLLRDLRRSAESTRRSDRVHTQADRSGVHVSVTAQGSEKSRMKSRIALVAIAVTLAAIGESAAAARPHVSVSFLRGEQLGLVSRPGSTPLDAVHQLIAGPTRAEIELGFRTYMPTHTRVLSVNVASRIATVD